ncbi:hypothetical protein ACFXGA_10115 [Actinosynnema sp. NPDC059335]|uniref:hypothetical protein n=1 Tax=Actinosynnema sp. NPDC059335 TaxID=3346804 RepID=UPI003671CB20
MIVPVVMALVLGWIAFLTISIAREPEPGAASFEDLARDLRASLDNRDRDAFGNLVDYPSSGIDNFTDSYFDRLDEVKISGTTVTPGRSRGGFPQIVVSGRSESNGEVSFAQAVVEKDGRWLLSPLPVP